MNFSQQDLQPLTTAVVGSNQFSTEQVAALEAGLLGLLNDTHFLHKLVHALMSVPHQH